MSLEQGKINSSQFMLLMMGFIIGSSIVLVPGNKAGHDAWIAVILGMLEGIFFAIIYTMLSIRFKGKNLLQINEIVYGSFFSKFVSILFLWFLFHVGSLSLGTFVEFFTTTTLPQTPEAILVILIVLVCAYAVRNGIEVIARCALILVLMSIVAFFTSSFFLIKNFDLNNLFPILEVPVKDLVIAAHGAASFPFAQTVVFLMIIPYLSGNRSPIFPVITALIFGGIFLIMVSVRNIGVLGPLNEIYTFPTFQTDRLINVGNLFTRLEIITVVGFLTMGFLKITVLLYTSVIGGAELFNLRTHKPLVIPVGILMAILSLHNFRNIGENIAFAQQIYPIYAMPFELGIPLLTLIIALIRKLPKSG